MNESYQQYFRIIGKIQSAISKSPSFDAAVKTGVDLLLENTPADYAVLWFLNQTDGLLHPYYWICPEDLTALVHTPGEGLVGRCYAEKQTIRMLNYAESPDESTDRDFTTFAIGSVVCVPFSAKHTDLGCIEFVKKGGVLTEDDASLCEIMTLLNEVATDENIPAFDTWSAGKVLMRVKELVKNYQNGDGSVTNVLKGVNFDVFEGELLCFLGESGCGKSTTLNIIGGLDEADSGSVVFEGRELIRAGDAELTEYRRKSTGFVFQNYNLMPNLTAKQNLDLIAELVDDPMDSAEALELVGLSDKQSNYPSQLSGGQQQRVSIARALVKHPKLIFADEPTAALDYETSIEVLAALEQVVAAGTTLIMVTHNVEITKMANRVIRFRGGKLHDVTINPHPSKASELVW